MIGQMISESLTLGLNYSDRLLKGIEKEQFACFASPGGKTIQSNHPAFVFGHLTLYAPRVMQDLGVPEKIVPIPAKFAEVFNKDTTCQHDPDGQIYPSMEEIVQVYFDGYRAAQEVLRASPDELFLKSNQNEAMRKRFETVGSMLAFYCGGHVMMHLGQVSAWRRMAGYPAA